MKPFPLSPERYTSDNTAVALVWIWLSAVAAVFRTSSILLCLKIEYLNNFTHKGFLIFLKEKVPHKFSNVLFVLFCLFI